MFQGWFLKADKKLVHSPHSPRTSSSLLSPQTPSPSQPLSGEVNKVFNYLHFFICICQVSPLLHSICPGQQCPRLPDQERGCPHQVVQLQVGIVLRSYHWGPPRYIIHVFVENFFNTTYLPNSHLFLKSSTSSLHSLPLSFYQVAAFRSVPGNWLKPDQSRGKPKSAPAERRDCCQPSLKSSWLEDFSLTLSVEKLMQLLLFTTRGNWRLWKWLSSEWI